MRPWRCSEGWRYEIAIIGYEMLPRTGVGENPQFKIWAVGSTIFHMFSEIESTRLQLGLCPARVLLLARYAAKREDINALTDMSAVERYDLLELLKVMRDYGRPVSYRCAVSA